VVAAERTAASLIDAVVRVALSGAVHPHPHPDPEADDATESS
jgi:hypothetical protein